MRKFAIGLAAAGLATMPLSANAFQAATGIEPSIQGAGDASVHLAYYGYGPGYYGRPYGFYGRHFYGRPYGFYGRHFYRPYPFYRPYGFYGRPYGRYFYGREYGPGYY